VIEYDSRMHVHLEKHNVSDIDVARAAWVSNYGEDAREKESSRVEGLINFLYREKHMSPFEHGGFTFFVDCPIFVAREFMRHRTWSYNEVSGRYTTLKPKFYLPAPERPLVQQGKIGNYYFTPGTDEQYVQMTVRKKQTIELAWKNYQEQLDLGIAREVSRDELPVGIYTQFYATANLRNVMQFLSLRSASNALYEIRDVAEQIEEYFEDSAPLVYKAFAEARAYDWEQADFKAKYFTLLKEHTELLEAVREMKPAVEVIELHGHVRKDDIT
jgi:thymidylate synthase (FAD)